MADLGFFSRILFFLFALTILVVITMVTVTRDTWGVASLRYMSDEISLRQTLAYRRQESEDHLPPALRKRPEIDRDNESSTQVDESIQQKKDMDVLEMYRAWDSKIGCRNFRVKIQDYEHRNTSYKSLQPERLAQCAELQQQHVSVLVVTSTWIPDSLNGLYTCDCGLSCLWTKSKVLAHDPDVHFYESSTPPSKRKQGQPLRVYIDMEAGGPRSDVEDIFVGYHSTAQVQSTYASNAIDGARSQYISPTKRLDVLVYWSSSRCLPGRQEIALGFLSQISHHSFGKCLNNVGRNLDSDEDPLFDMYPQCKAEGAYKHWSRHIHCAMSHYMFALAIENTITESYVTEKLFYALEVGTVPIYFGAPNVLDLVPPNSIIQASKFKTTEDLVTYVEQVARDPVQYAEFHAWRRCGELGNYRHTWGVSFDNLPCRLCAAASKLGGKNTPGGDAVSDLPI